MVVELGQTSMVPCLLQPEVLQWLDMVSLLAEAHIQAAALAQLPGPTPGPVPGPAPGPALGQAPGPADVISVLTVQGSVYHADVSSIVLGIIHARNTPYDEDTLDSP